MIYFKSQFLQRLYCILIVFMLVSCSADLHDHPHLTTGKQFYEYHCVSCHRDNGLGLFLKGMPANILNDKSQSEIIYHIRHRHSLSQEIMPVFKTMPFNEAHKISRYLLKLKSEHTNKIKQSDKG